MREIPPRIQESSVPWRNLTRIEILFYLNRGGIVGVWLEELRRQGFIQTREKRRVLATAAHISLTSAIKQFRSILHSAI
jgi:hypothetical protein